MKMQDQKIMDQIFNHGWKKTGKKMDLTQVSHTYQKATLLKYTAGSRFKLLSNIGHS